MITCAAVAEPRDRHRVLERGAKGLERSLDLGLERRNRLLQMRNHAEMLAEQKPMVDT
jgi:hypothetical protein